MQKLPYDLCFHLNSLSLSLSLSLARPYFYKIENGLNLLLELIKDTDIYNLPEDFYYLFSLIRS